MQKYVGLLITTMHTAGLMTVDQLNTVLKDPSGKTLEAVLGGDFSQISMQHMDGISRFFGVNCYSRSFIDGLFSEDISLEYTSLEAPLDEGNDAKKRQLELLETQLKAMFADPSGYNKKSGRAGISGALQMLRTMKYYSAQSKILAEAVSCQITTL